MGMIRQVISALFGGGGNVVADTAAAFLPHADRESARAAQLRQAAMAQMAQEFAQGGRRGWFDRLIDALNRVPRPAMALGTLGLFVAAMVDPVWFAARMQGLALVPEPLWWLLGVIVSFYFGARFQAKGQEMRRDLARVSALAEALSAQDAEEAPLARGPRRSGASLPLPVPATDAEANPALAEWRRLRGDG